MTLNYEIQKATILNGWIQVVFVLCLIKEKECCASAVRWMAILTMRQQQVIRLRYWTLLQLIKFRKLAGVKGHAKQLSGAHKPGRSLTLNSSLLEGNILQKGACS